LLKSEGVSAGGRACQSTRDAQVRALPLARQVPTRLFEFFSIAPHQMALGQQPEHDMVGEILDHRQFLGAGALERLGGGLHVHAGHQDGILVLGKIAHQHPISGRIAVQFGHDQHADIFIARVDGDDPLGRAERDLLAEIRQRRRGIDGLDVLAHHRADGEAAHPADIMGAADRLAAQMEAPCREGIAEGFAHQDRRHDRGGQHDAGER